MGSKCKHYTQAGAPPQTANLNFEFVPTSRQKADSHENTHMLLSCEYSMQMCQAPVVYINPPQTRQYIQCTLSYGTYCLVGAAGQPGCTTLSVHASPMPQGPGLGWPCCLLEHTCAASSQCQSGLCFLLDGSCSVVRDGAFCMICQFSEVLQRLLHISHTNSICEGACTSA